MHTLQNARMTALGRGWLLRRQIDQGEGLYSLAAQAGISDHTAYKWLARKRADGSPGLVGRRGFRRNQRRTDDPHKLERGIDLRHDASTLRRFVRALVAPLSALQPTEPLRRYQCSRYCDMPT